MSFLGRCHPFRSVEVRLSGEVPETEPVPSKVKEGGCTGRRNSRICLWVSILPVGPPIGTTLKSNPPVPGGVF